MTNFRHTRSLFRGALPLLGLALAAAALAAQSSPDPRPLQSGTDSPASITGVVTDPSGYVIANATVTLHPTELRPDVAGPTPPSPDVSTTTPRTGRYALTAPSSSSYLVIVTAAGFATYESEPIHLVRDHPVTLDVHLKIEKQSEQVDVSDDQTGTDPNHNGDALVLKGRAIDQLPLDSTQLMQELQGLAGSPTPDLMVDGFSGGQLPPRDTIREIRINQNPYSAENDTNPSNGQIQIFTKPGTNKFHGNLYAYGNPSGINTRNPFVAYQPSYYSFYSNGNISGPITKHSSFFVNYGRSQSETNSLINAQILDPANNANQIPFTLAVPTPNTGQNLSLRGDFSPFKSSTVIARYTLNTSHQINGGVGGLNLLSQAYDGNNENQNLQLSNSQIISPKIVNDTRFQYTRSRVLQIPTDNSPTISVAGAFTMGGSSGGRYNDNQDRYELQNYISHSLGKQFLTYGGRWRMTRDANQSRANYNGTYTFATLAAYQAALNGTKGQVTQYSVTQGQPGVAVSVSDAGLFLQDDWKARPNLTLSSGLRFETQSGIADHADWAPRLGLAYGFGGKKDKPQPFTLRGGAGLFYTRFGSGYMLQAERQNGVTQQQFIVPNADLDYDRTKLGSAQAPSAIYRISPTFHSPYYFTSTLSVEHQVRKAGSVTVSWLSFRGVHSQVTRNVNAPLPGTYDPAIPTSGVRPFGGNQNIFQYSSEGLFRSNRLVTNFFLRFHQGEIMLYGNYQLRHDTSDAFAGSFASNQYNLGADFGRSNLDTRHTAYVGSGVEFPFNIHAYAFARASSGAPFNITVGQDLNGDSIFNDRPAFATDLARPSVVHTQYGVFDTSPIAGQTIIPNNFGRGPGFFTVNVDLGRTFHFGPVLKAPAGATPPKLKPGEKPQVDRRFTLDFGIDAENLFNQVNLAAPTGTLNSPLFGRSTSLSGNGGTNANRTINVQAFFRF